MRNGDWVTTSTPIPGAHQTPDGRAIGIYQRASRRGREAMVGVDGADPEANATPEHVAFVRPDGTNLMRLGDDGQAIVKVACSPADLADLRLLIEADHIPGGRGDHLDPGEKLHS